MESYAYDGRNLSEVGDVVVVSVNHRLNTIGTMDLSAYGAQYENSRNKGMANLVAALRWVQDNVAQFGTRLMLAVPAVVVGFCMPGARLIWIQ